MHIILLIHIYARHEIGSHKKLLLAFSFFYFLFDTLCRVSCSILSQRTKIMYDLIENVDHVYGCGIVAIFYERREVGHYFISVQYLFWHCTHHKIVIQLLV